MDLMDLIGVLLIIGLIYLIVDAYDCVRKYGKKELFLEYYYAIICVAIATIPFYLIWLVFPEIKVWIHVGLGFLGLFVICFTLEKLNFPEKFWKIREELKGNV